MAKTLTTDTLITTALRRAMIPEEQSTFTDADIIDMMNEEFNIHIVPMVMRAHEEFYIDQDDQTIVANKSTYKIPYRALGNKTRSSAIVDSGGGFSEMTRLSYEDRQKGHNILYGFYVENDSLILEDNLSTNGKLRTSYYLQPNTLVKAERAATTTAISNKYAEIVSTSYADLPTDSIEIAGVTFVAQSGAATLGDATFQAATSDTATATSLAAQINAHATTSVLVTATSSTATVTVLADTSTYDLPDPVYTNTTGTVGLTTTTTRIKFTVDQVPTHFTSNTVFDFIQGVSINKILGYDRTVAAIDSTNLTIAFPVSELQTVDPKSTTTKDITFAVGDYILIKQETHVPQLPTALHPILAQRTAVKMLEALGDYEGMAAAEKQLATMEKNANTLIDNRTEGHGQKINPKNTPLKSSMFSRSFTRR